jgi:hypothetical protein
MMRLTKRNKDTSYESNVGCSHFGSKECHEVVGNCADGCKWEEEIWRKLAEYEDLEEQGLLIRVPCKVGQTVYVIAQAFNMETNTSRYKVFTRRIDQIRGNKLNPVYFVTDGSDSFAPSSIGRRVFLTKAEAEQALAEMEKEK